MSIIAWDGKTLAADKQMDLGGMRLRCTKIYKLGPYRLVGIVGGLCHGLEIMRWLTDHGEREDYPKPSGEGLTRLIVVTRLQNDGVDIKMYEGNAHPILFEERFAAWGCGRDYALGAMECGADARTAVEIACRYDVYCGMGIDTLKFEDK